jgi:hypothetical protein
MTDPTRPPVSARRAAVGFKHSSQLLSLRLADEELDKLRKRLQDGSDEWLEVQATDGAVLVHLGEIAYLQVESGEHRVGF